MNGREFQQLLTELYGQTVWPKPLHKLSGIVLIEAGMTVQEAAGKVGTTRAALEAVLEASDPLGATLGCSIHEVDSRHRQRAIQTLGQLLVGRAAELAFEDIYRDEMESDELELVDHRGSRSDTDYRLHNGQGRPVYRVNIKFHGALFESARERVGLEPDDCFALATYKIHGALKKQEQEGLPYIFVIVGVRSLSGEIIGRQIPSRYVDGTAYIYQAPKATGKRDFEDRVVQRLADQSLPVFQRTYEQIHKTEWYVLSARRADRLVHDLLYERVFALRIPRFNQQFRRAEVDMHFSLADDLTPLPDFLAKLRENPANVVTLLERGSI